MENNGQTSRGCRRRARRVQGDGEEMQETWRRVLGFRTHISKLKKTELCQVGDGVMG
jgi:hypothetical protein